MTPPCSVAAPMIMAGWKTPRPRISPACEVEDPVDGVAARISSKSLRGSKPVADMNCRNSLSFDCICDKIYCPKGEVTLWATFMPETTVASGMTRFNSAGVTPAVAVAAAATNEKAIEYSLFIGNLLHSTSKDGQGSCLLHLFCP